MYGVRRTCRCPFTFYVCSFPFQIADSPSSVSNLRAQSFVNRAFAVSNKLFCNLRILAVRFWWLVDRTEQGQFRFFWAPGMLNLADYYTKKHPASHHKKVRPIYLYIEGKSHKGVWQCDKILTSGSTTRQCTDTLKCTDKR